MWQIIHGLMVSSYLINKPEVNLHCIQLELIHLEQNSHHQIKCTAEFIEPQIAFDTIESYLNAIHLSLDDIK